jgi:hypothetical protein
VSSGDLSYEKLAASYDSWEVPELFELTYETLNANLRSLVDESAKHQDPSYQLLFLETLTDLDTWVRTRLQPSEALTYQGRLVTNRDAIVQRTQYRLQELDIRIRQKSQEAAEAGRLLDIIGRPKTVSPAQFNAKEGPVLDADTLEKLVKRDYVGPVVQRITGLQEELHAFEAEKARLEKQLSLLPKSLDTNLSSLPPGYRDLIGGLSRDLGAIIQNYDRLLEDYLTARIISLVVVNRAPVVSRSGYSPTLVLPGIALGSALLALFLLVLERLFERAREAEAKK